MTNFYRVIEGDSLKILPILPYESVDLVITDPPYGKNIGKVTNSSIGRTSATDGRGSVMGGSHVVEVNRYPLIDWDFTPLSKETFELIKKISKNQIIFGYNYATDVFGSTNGLIVWDKKCRNDWNDTFSDGEIIYTSFKIPLKIYRQRWMGLMRENEFQDEGKRVHPTQKPVQLIEWLLRKFSKPNEVILDPFLGSATTMLACRNLNRSCIGIEIEPKYCQLSLKRCQSEAPLGESVLYQYQRFVDGKLVDVSSEEHDNREW